MNDRIRLLAKQADIHFSKSGTLDAGPNGIAKFVLYADLEKFAELIVIECFKAAMIESKGHMNPIDLMNGMKKRIGITK